TFDILIRGPGTAFSMPDPVAEGGGRSARPETGHIRTWSEQRALLLLDDEPGLWRFLTGTDAPARGVHLAVGELDHERLSVDHRVRRAQRHSIGIAHEREAALEHRLVVQAVEELRDGLQPLGLARELPLQSRREALGHALRDLARLRDPRAFRA